jgi:hypothetical protein
VNVTNMPAYFRPPILREARSCEVVVGGPAAGGDGVEERSH